MLMNLANMSLPNLGSGRMCDGGLLLYGTCVNYFLAFISWDVWRRTWTALPTIADAGAIERAAHRVVANPGQILDAAAADQDHRVFL